MTPTELIEREIAGVPESHDFSSAYNYALGLVEMAYMLGHLSCLQHRQHRSQLSAAQEENHQEIIKAFKEKAA